LRPGALILGRTAGPEKKSIDYSDFILALTAAIVLVAIIVLAVAHVVASHADFCWRSAGDACVAWLSRAL